MVHYVERVGYDILTFGYDFEYGGRDVWITDFYITPEYCDQGFGTESLRLVEKRAVNLGVQAMHLMIHDHNARAVRVYRKLGFKRNFHVPVVNLLA